MPSLQRNAPPPRRAVEPKISPPRSAWPEIDFSASTFSSAQPTSAPNLSPQEMISSTNLYGCEFCSFFASDYEAVVIHEQRCAAADSAPIDHSQVSTFPSPPRKPEPEQTDVLGGLSLPVLHRAFTKLCPRHGTALGVAGFPRLLRLLQQRDPAVSSKLLCTKLSSSYRTCCVLYSPPVV